MWTTPLLRKVLHTKICQKTEKTQTLKHLRSCKVKPRKHLRSQYHEKNHFEEQTLFLANDSFWQS